MVVGQGKGESVFVRIPPDHWLAVDSLELLNGGRREPAFRLFAPADLNLQCVVLTHPHRDHCVGFRALVERAPPGVTVGCAEPFVTAPRELHRSTDAEAQLAWGATEDALMAVIDRWETEPGSEWLLEAGTGITMGGATVTCLYPDRAAIDRFFKKRQNPNVCSSPLLIEWEGARVILGADLPRSGWRHIERQGHDPVLGQHSALKVPHHGSRGAQHVCFTVCPDESSRTWLVAPWNREQGPPRFDDGHDVAVMLESIPEVHLTWLPLAAETLRSRRIAVSSGEQCWPQWSVRGSATLSWNTLMTRRLWRRRHGWRSGLPRTVHTRSPQGIPR